MAMRLNLAVRGLFATPVAALEVPEAERLNAALSAAILARRARTPRCRPRTPAAGIPTATSSSGAARRPAR